MQDRWISDEPTLGSVFRGVLRRGARRWRWVLVISGVLTLAVVGLRVAKPPLYESTLYFRLAESEIPISKLEPGLPRDIREYIFAIALSRKQVEAMLRKHGRSIGWLDRDPTGAVDDFRFGISIGVSRNYFVYARDEDEPPRSAQVTISMTSTDEAQNRSMLGDIRDAIVDDQRQRAASLERARDFFRTQLADARARTRKIEGELERLSKEAARMAPIARIPVEARMGALRAEASAVIERAVTLERAAGTVEFKGSAERNQLGLDLELVDERTVTFAPRLTAAALAVRALSTLSVILLLALFVAGAADDRVYAPEDLESRGVPVFGVVPWLPGEDAGSQAARA